MTFYFFLAAGLYWLCVIYGSLVPLDFNAKTFDEALDQFAHIRYLNLGSASRADWIANIVLYIPLAFLSSAAVSGIRAPVLRFIGYAGVFGFCLLTAVAVEFSQLFFPPRTVSLNDLNAEALGTLVGVLAWHFFGAYFSTLAHLLRRGDALSVRSALVCYLLIYTILSLFPFDIVTSFDELATKLALGQDALLLPFDACRADSLRCSLKLALEIVAVLPFGFLLCYLPYSRYGIVATAFIGCLFGIVLEVVQIFLLSGQAQGMSVMTRMVGMGAGAALAGWLKQQKLATIMPLLPRGVRFAIAPYILMVLAINGGLTSDWLTLEQALNKLAQTHFLPLYYFYYTSEAVALVSLLTNLGLYAPVGVFCWVLFQQRRPHWLYVGMLAAVLALVVETGKLFLADKHADPSDVWLAFIAAAASYVLITRGFNQFYHTNATVTLAPIVSANPTPSPVSKGVLTPEVDNRWRIVSLLLWSIIAIMLCNYPLNAVALGLLLIGYTALLMYRLDAWLLIVPMLLPIMDFAPWTGRFFFDEFDLLILTTVACYYWQRPKRQQRSLLSIPTRLLLLLFVLLSTASVLQGLLPLEAIDANAFTNYYSHYNSLRVAKGMLWALLLLPLLQQSVRRYRHAPQYLAYGVLAGLAGVIVVSCWERFLFSGLFNFASNFRIIALFSTMHTGGGHIDAYLALTLPFITVLFLQPSARARLLGIGFLVTGLYVLLVTFSRGPYVAAVIEAVVLGFGVLWCSHGSQRQRYVFWSLPVLALLVLIAQPIINGSFMQARFNDVERDKAIRLAHWHDAIAMMDDDIVTQLIGMGSGSYPRTYVWRTSEQVIPAMYKFEREQSNSYLKLSAGDSLYMSQAVASQPDTQYRLSVDVRSHGNNVTLTLPLCEQSLLYSFRCSWHTVTAPAQPKQWQHIEQLVESQAVGAPLDQVMGALSKRPVRLSLYNSGANTVIDVDNVQLIDKATGKNLITNGDFSNGLDHWFFATNNHLPWHVKNLAVQLLFDQGWLGLSLFILLCANAVYVCYQKVRQKAVFSVILLSSFCGFIVVGFVDSPFDAPRLTLLFFLLLLFSLLRTPKAWAIP